MARAVWSGMISFGLVSVPVGLFTATEEHEPSFHQFAEGSTDRIRYKRVNERTGDEVDFANIVKGVDVGGGKYVMVTDEELDQVAPGRSRALEISSFVDLDDIDPIYFNKAYYLAPAGDESKKTYALLRDAMAETNRAGIATFVMHGKQHLAAIRASGNTLVLETLFFADEVRDPKKTLDNLPGKTSFSKGELAMATQLITSMDEPWKPERYRDTYTDRVNDLIEAKRRGHEVQQADEAPEATNVIDLLEALRRSVDSCPRAAARRRPRKPTAQEGRSAKKTPAKKAPAKKAAAKAAPASASRGKHRDARQDARLEQMEVDPDSSRPTGRSETSQDRRAGRLESGAARAARPSARPPRPRGSWCSATAPAGCTTTSAWRSAACWSAGRCRRVRPWIRRCAGRRSTSRTIRWTTSTSRA